MHGVQVPLVTITDRLKKATGSDLCGNVIFWISFCILGQPTAVILYYHDWVLENRPEWVHSTLSAVHAH